MSKPAETFTIHAAKTHLSKLVARAEAGEEIVLARGKEPVAKIVPLKPPAETEEQPREPRRRAMHKFGVRGSGGGLIPGSLRGLPVAEADALDDLGETLRAVQPAPVPLGRLGQLEDHRERRLA
jgi:prevent-host-death family protein